MSLREWLVLIGIIIIAGVMADGYRRMRLARKRSEELSFGREGTAAAAAASASAGGDNYGSELPNGGARKSGDGYSDSFSENDRQPRDTVRNWARQEESAHLAVKDRIEPGLSDFDQQSSSYDSGNESSGRQSFSTEKKNEDEVPTLTQVNEPIKRQSVSQEMSMVDEMEHEARDRITAEQTSRMVQQELEMAPSRAKKKGSKRQEKLSDRPSASEVLIINLLTKEEPFEGSVLLQSFLDAGMRYGDMSIFHRYTRKDGTGQVLFSLANGIEPGTFDALKMENSRTPVISLFMGLPGPGDPLKAFTLMEETARQLALDLGAELKDEDMSVLTRQTLEHYRQRIRDFERKALTHKVTD